MRVLGTRSSLSSFRWELVYLHASLAADSRPEVKALASDAQAMRTQLTTQRADLEAAEDAVVIASALVNATDASRDGVLKELGGVARATDKEAYGGLFPKINPSKTARLPVDEESKEIARILGELGKMAADHPLRATYLQALTDTEGALKVAATQATAADTALALQRSQTERLKLSLDKGRLEIHGKLLTLVKDKDAADAFFRPSSGAPGEEEKKPEPAPT